MSGTGDVRHRQCPAPAIFAAMRAALARVAAHICRLYGIDAETLKRVARA